MLEQEKKTATLEIKLAIQFQNIFKNWKEAREMFAILEQ